MISKKNLTIAALAFFLLIVAFALGRISGTGTPKKPEVPPYILSMTQPIMEVTGEVREIQDNTLTVYTRPPVSRKMSANIPEMIYTVRITEKTKFARGDVYDPRPTPQVTENKTAPSFKNLTKGTVVRITSGIDLRKVTDQTFDAMVVNIQPKQVVLIGKVVKTAENQLEVFQTTLPPGYMKNPYMDTDSPITVTIGKNTVLRMNEPYTGDIRRPPAQTTASISDLKEGMSVYIILDTDVNEKHPLNALEINMNRLVPTPSADTTQ